MPHLRMIIITLALLAAACGGDGVSTPADTDLPDADVGPDANPDVDPDADTDLPPELTLELTGGEDSPYVIDATTGTVSFEAACAPEGCEVARCTIGFADEAPRLLDSCEGAFELDTLLLDREGTWTLTAEAERGLERTSVSRTFEVLYAFEAGLEGFSPGESYTYSHPPELNAFCTREDTCQIQHHCEDESGAPTNCEELAIPALPAVTIIVTACATNTESAHCLAEQRYTFVYEDPTWVDVSAGDRHTCGILDDGTLWCWGSNLYGELGDGTTSQRAQPTLVVEAGPWAMVSAGGEHTCAIKEEGSLWCWGQNTANQVSTEPGNLVSYTTPHRIGNDTNWSTVATGSEHSCAIQTDGALFCWGYDGYGQLGPSIRSQGQVKFYSGGSTIDTFVAVAAGDAHTCAVTAEGANGWCWGSFSSGQLNGDSTGTSDPRQVGSVVSMSNSTTLQIAAGGTHSCAIVDLGTEMQSLCWGSDEFGQLGRTIGGSSAFPVDGLYAFSTLSTGADHTCAIADEVAYCWGRSAEGRLGHNGNNTIPTEVSTLNSGWTDIAAGTEHTCGVSAGTMYCWGLSASGRLGNPAAGGATPTPIAWPYTP